MYVSIVIYMYACLSLCRGQDNLWIVKPWNLGRGLGIHITKNLIQIIRLSHCIPRVSAGRHRSRHGYKIPVFEFTMFVPQSFCFLTTPFALLVLSLPLSLPSLPLTKVACKYITDPVLFHRDDVGDVKFDIRYIVLLKSTKPLVLYSYDIFWLRFANKYVPACNLHVL